MSLIARDLQHLWHPCSQMKDYELFKPLEIISASGSHLTLKDGQKIIDAISSWWCKSLGHNHPRLKRALMRQVEKFEHVILANTTNETIVALSEKLAKLTQSLNKVFYASDGSCATEIAMKMSLHARQISGEGHRNQFVALANGYHGETIGAMSVSDLGLYRAPYESLMFKTTFITPPYLLSVSDPCWLDASFAWMKTEQQLEPLRDSITAIMIEPIVQGAGGMNMYSQDYLKRLREYTQQHGIHLIADEIMTGIGRTGKMLACEHAKIEPDFLCLSKGLTSGWLPLSAVLTRQSIYDVFYDDYETGKSFLHSHTFSGNALAACVANEVLDIVAEEKLYDRANYIGQIMRDNMRDIAERTQKITNVRGIGAIVAADLVTENPKDRYGYAVYRKAVELGALLRPLGNTIYWLPPLNVEESTLSELKQITETALLSPR
jgi:adenosylmethionine-8-amino-7-oxononanoate aminotransferase